MIVLETELASKAHARLDVAARAHLNGAEAVAHFLERRRFDVIQRQRNRAAVELEHHVRQNLPPVPFRLERRDSLVAITIDQRNDAVGDTRSGRQIDLQLHARVRERHARGLKVFVETMGGRRRGQHKKKARRRRREAAPLTASSSCPRNHSLDRDRSYGCGRRCCRLVPVVRTR